MLLIAGRATSTAGVQAVDIHASGWNRLDVLTALLQAWQAEGPQVEARGHQVAVDTQQVRCPITQRADIEPTLRCQNDDLPAPSTAQSHYSKETSRSRCSVRSLSRCRAIACRNSAALDPKAFLTHSLG